MYVFVLEGDGKIDGEMISERDGIGISETDTVSINASSVAEILLMGMPMG